MLLINSLGNSLIYINRIILAFIFLVLFSVSLKSQYNAIEKIDNLNIDSIINNLIGLQLPEYWILKNHHSPRNRRIIFHSSREFLALCMFDQSCIYSFSDRNSTNAINKIFGYSFGSNHHNNSFRLGWRCRNNLIEILAY